VIGILHFPQIVLTSVPVSPDRWQHVIRLEIFQVGLVTIAGKLTN
jgi:hypothetical protein